jgi:hypothetical protein
MHTEMAVIGGIVVRLIVVAMFVVIWVMMMNVNDYPVLHLAKHESFIGLYMSGIDSFSSFTSLVISI